MPNKAVFFYWLILIAASTLCSRHFSRMSRADRYLCFFLWTTLVVEIAAYEIYVRTGNNLLLYDIFNPVELLLICLYFDGALRVFKRSHVAAIIGAVSLGISYSATLFIKGHNWVSEYFLTYESALIITFCLLALYEILMDEEHMPYRFTNFWITVSLLIYWSIAISGWGILPAITETDKKLAHVFRLVQAGNNYLFYTGLALVFLCYKKLIPSGA